MADAVAQTSGFGVAARPEPDRSDAELLTVVKGVYGMVIEAVNHAELDAERTKELLTEIVLSTLEPATSRPSDR